LFVTLDTVKTHTRHLYAKLGVHKRHEAVARARDLDILSYHLFSGRLRPTWTRTLVPFYLMPSAISLASSTSPWIWVLSSSTPENFFSPRILRVKPTSTTRP
jgi:hypothetical protein